jgi:pimeloyl-ACP methyl ester carboxylesterase
LRGHFTATHGVPQRTFVVGESKGGLVALVLMETAPSEFDGALAISGLLSSPYTFLQRAFELLRGFERQFPSVLPSPADVPPTYLADEQTVRRVLEALGAKSSAASLLREQASVQRNEELAELLAFHTDALRDLQMRCGGNPFESRPRASTDSGRGVPVVRSKATECALSLPAPTGTLGRPFLAVDTQYDPVIPGWSASEYRALLRKAGRERFFAREVLPGEGHLNVAVADRVRAFAALVQWSVDGVRPLGL